MSLTTTKLIRQYERVKRDEAKRTPHPASHYLRALIIESLSHNERAVYEYLLKSGPGSSQVVAEKFALSINHALNVLNRLHQYGLVSKRINEANTYREYLWSVSNNERQN